jgi:signal transduction histidine kinase
LTPFYRSAWFLMLMVADAAAFVLAAYRTRIARTLALERQRTRIAMDLHDEMGSRLGSIGLLADLAADETVDEQRRMRLLNEIAETAAGLGLSLTDIVWSLRRGQMTMESLARHLAGHGRRLFPGNHPAFEPRFPDTWPVIELSLSAGRNALLVGLEALHNAAQHARPGRVVLELRPEGRHWRLMVSDDGQGFDHGVVPGGGGFGLETMRRRAAEIGATLDVHSSAGHGTSVALLFNPKAEDRRLPTTKIRKIWNVV